jgi:Winged helix DNA-binding domain
MPRVVDVGAESLARELVGDPLDALPSQPPPTCDLRDRERRFVGVWGKSARATWTTVRTWVGSEPERHGSPDDLIMRYVSAFGPSTPADAQSWSGLPAMREVFERLRPRLRTLRDEDGRELFDTPRAPLPDPNTPAPVRFLPQYDNVLLAHKDRTRIVPPGVSQWADIGWASVLVDGFLAARWWLDREKDAATLRVDPLRRLTRAEKAGVVEEGGRLVAFLADDATTRDVLLRRHPDRTRGVTRSPARTPGSRGRPSRRWP